MKRGKITIIAGVILFAAILGTGSCYPRLDFNGSQPSSTTSPMETGTIQRATFTPFQPLTNTATLTDSPTTTGTSQPTNTATPTSTLTSSITFTPTNTPTPLDEANIEGVKGRWAAYNLDCEARSAVDWAAYFGVQISEIEFLNALPRSDDPDLGFVGEVNAAWGSIPPQAYGVHAQPVADLLEAYGLDAMAITNLTWDQLRAEISQDRPVIAWVVGRVGRGTPIPYTTSSGRETTVARFEHTVIVIGYNKTEVTLLDGYWIYTRTIQDFQASWSVLGNMAILWGGNIE